jgi:hypothetical protein
MVNARNGNYEQITFYNASWEVDQNMLPQTKHINQPTTMSIKQQGQKLSLSLYGIDDNMHPQKQKSDVSQENVIEKPKHFHWKPMHNEQLENLMTTFPFSTLRDVTNKFLINNSTLIKIHSSIFSFVSLSLKKCKSCKKINLCLNNIKTLTNTNVSLNDIPQTHYFERHSHVLTIILCGPVL